MQSLKKRIEQLERDITLENIYLAEQQRLFKENTQAKFLLGCVLCSAFMTSFLISYKRSIPQAMGKITNLSMQAIKFYSRVKFFLPMLNL